MFRPRHFITVAAVCMMAAGCTSKDDGRVNMEILLSTVWCGERFTPDIQQNTVPERDAESALFLYIFGEDGILSVFAAEGEGTASEPVEQLRYIYTPKAAEMVIEFIRNVHRTGDIGRAAVAGGGHRQPRPSVPCGHGRGSGKGTSCGASAQRTKEINDALEKPHSHVGRHPGTLSAPVL